jgi:hypothetical protein
MRLLVAFAAVIALLLCLPAAAPACPPATQAVFGAGYGDSCAAPVGAVGYGMPLVAQAPAYMVRPVVAAAPLYGGFSSVGAYGASPVIVNQTVVRGRPGLLGRLRAARQGFRRGF